jgi:hypothetical protein
VQALALLWRFIVTRSLSHKEVPAPSRTAFKQVVLLPDPPIETYWSMRRIRLSCQPKVTSNGENSKSKEGLTCIPMVG